MILNIKHSPIGKPTTTNGKQLTFGWQRANLSAIELLQHIGAGKPFAVGVYRNGHRRADNFIESAIFATDHDKGASDNGLTDNERYELLNHPLIQKYAFGAIQTNSSQPGAWRYRVLFKIENPITDVKTYQAVYAALVSLLPFTDTAAKDAARAFYGSRPGTLPDYVNYDAVLNIETIYEQHLASLPIATPREFDHTEFGGKGFENFIYDLEQRIGFTNELIQYGAMRGWSKALACPMQKHEHDDSNPAAHWNPEIHALKCFKCGETFNAKSVGTAQGLDLYRYLPHTPYFVEPTDVVSSTHPVSHSCNNLIRVTSRYLNETDLPTELGQTIAIQSPIGTGKTEWIKEFTQGKKRVLVVGHLRRLLRNTAKRLDFDYYEELSEQTSWGTVDKLVICANSLYKLLNNEYRLPKYDAVIIDESEQVLSYLLNSKTFTGSHGKTTHSLLSRIVESVYTAIIADADLSEISINWLEERRGEITIIKNDYNMERGNMQVFSNEDLLVKELLVTMESSNTTVAIASDSRKQTKALHKLLSEKSYYGIVVHGDNSDDPELLDTLKNINAKLPNYDYIVYSPAMTSGIDITAPVEHVFGFFNNRNVTAEEQHQLLGRCRNARQFYVYSPERLGERETNPQVLKSWVLENNSEHAARHGITLEMKPDGVFAPSEADMTFLSLWANVEAKQNKLLNNPRTAFIIRAKREYQVEFIGGDNTDHKELTDVSKAITQKERTLLLNVDPVSDLEYRKTLQEIAAGKRKATEQDHANLAAGNKRHHIESFYGQELTDDLLTVHENDGVRNTCFFIDYHSTHKQLVQRDITDIKVGIPQQLRVNRAEKVRIIKLLLKTVFPYGLHAGEFSEDEIQDKLVIFNRLYDLENVNRVFMRTGTLSHRPIARFRWVLSLMGLRFNRKRGGKYHDQITYSISVDHYEQMRGIANMRLVKVLELQEQVASLTLKESASDTLSTRKGSSSNGKNVARGKSPPENPYEGAEIPPDVVSKGDDRIDSA